MDLGERGGGGDWDESGGGGVIVRMHCMTEE